MIYRAGGSFLPTQTADFPGTPSTGADEFVLHRYHDNSTAGNGLKNQHEWSGTDVFEVPEATFHSYCAGGALECSDPKLEKKINKKLFLCFYHALEVEWVQLEFCEKGSANLLHS